MRERRRTRRTTLDTGLIATVKRTLPARIVDISPLGMLVEVAAALRPLASCEMEIPVDGAPIRVGATVRRCRLQGRGRVAGDNETMLYRAGLEFEPVPSDAIDRLQNLCGSWGPRSLDPSSGLEPIRIRVEDRGMRKLG